MPVSVPLAGAPQPKQTIDPIIWNFLMAGIGAAILIVMIIWYTADHPSKRRNPY